MAGKMYVGNSNDKSKSPVKIYYGDSSDKAKKVAKIYIGNSQNKAVKVWPNTVVPNIYQQVQYIQNSGKTQWIDPGQVYPDSNTTIEIRYIATNLPGSGIGYVFGCDDYGRVRASDRYRTAHSQYSLGHANNNTYFTVDFSESVANASTYVWRTYYRFNPFGGNTNPPLNTMIKLSINKPGGYSYLNDELIYSTTATFQNNAQYHGNVSHAKAKIILFGHQHMDSGNVDISDSSCVTASTLEIKLYQFTVLQYGIPIRDLYPCYRKSDNVIGLYDIVNEVFYTNGGIGLFYKGPNV